MAYRHTPETEARLADNRTRILAAAQERVSRGGWADAQVASIAAAAGVATGSVYRYFPSKAELFAQVLADVSQREVDVLGAIAALDQPASVRLQSAIATFVRRALRNPRLAYALIAEPCEKAIDEERVKYRAAIAGVLRAIIASGKHAGELRVGVRPDIAATVIVGGVMEGLAGPLSPFSGKSGEDSDAYRFEVAALAEQIALMAWAGVAKVPSTTFQGIVRSI
ncbi:MAG: TetR/AcrR family transcriptional regulator [Burkholderiaceae bacterium]